MKNFKIALHFTKEEFLNPCPDLGIFYRKDLSWAAKSIFYFLRTRLVYSTLDIEYIQKYSKNSLDSILEALRELENKNFGVFLNIKPNFFNNSEQSQVNENNKEIGKNDTPILLLTNNPRKFDQKSIRTLTNLIVNAPSHIGDGVLYNIYFNIYYINIYNIYNIINNNIIIYNKIIINNFIGTKTQSKSSNKKDIIKNKENNLITFWNKLSNTKKHKDPNTKVYKSVSKLLQAVKDGNFTKFVVLSDNFFKTHNISLQQINKKFTDEEIKEGLTSLANIYVDGYEPVNKENIKKFYLNKLLYNPFQKNSWFIVALINRIQLLEDKNKIDLKPLVTDMIHNIERFTTDKSNPYSNFNDKRFFIDKYIELFPKYVDLFVLQLNIKLNKNQMYKLINVILNLIIVFENSNFTNMSLGYTSQLSSETTTAVIGDPSKFLDCYISWFKSYYGRFINPMSVYFMGPKNQNWKEFCKYMWDRFFIKL